MEITKPFSLVDGQSHYSMMIVISAVHTTLLSYLLQEDNYY